MDRKNVLICEDDPLQLRILTAAFMNAGYRAIGARTPAEAVRKADLGSVDAVVADVQLEGGNAFDVVGNLKRIGLDAPVFMASAYATPALKERARAAGVKRFFEKPYPIMELVRMVGRALKERFAGRAAGRILVVEDHGPARKAISELLAEEGFDVASAEHGGRAIEALRAAKRPVDLVVMDLVVPGPSGAELVRRLREADPGTGILMLGGAATHEEIVAAYREGATSLLRKPFSEDALLRFVRAHLALARKRRAAAERDAKERARESAAPWFRRLGRAVAGGRRLRAAALVLGALVAGVCLARGVDAIGAAPGEDPGRVQRQMLDEMRRFSDGYQKELRWYGIAK
jgi:DNA-binding NtrC family response regulator